VNLDLRLRPLLGEIWEEVKKGCEEDIVFDARETRTHASALAYAFFKASCYINRSRLADFTRRIGSKIENDIRFGREGAFPLALSQFSTPKFFHH